MLPLHCPVWSSLVKEGDKALQLCEENEFDLIILDWDMPGKNGLEVLRTIRGNGSRTPVLMVTGESNRERILETIHSGVSDYLVKPFDQSALVAKLKKLCHGGLPVVDDHGRLIGVITEADLVQLTYDPEVQDEKVRDHMTEDVLTVDEETDLANVTMMMDEHRIRRIPVVRNGEVVGIIARRDLLRYVAENEEAVREFSAAAKVAAGA